MGQTMTKNNKSTHGGGLSEAAQREVIAEEIQNFTTLSKEKGELSIAEINELLPAEVLSPVVLDSFMMSLKEKGIIITENVKDIQSFAKSGDSFFLSDPEKPDEDEGREDSKGNDPVRLYLRKMGSVSLLTREGEVAIARRIEHGEREIVRAILMSPIGTKEIIDLGKRLDEGRIKVKAIFRGLEDEETQYDEKEYIEKIHELINHVKTYENKAQSYFKVLRSNPHKSTKSEKTAQSLAKLNQNLMVNFETINFNRKTINRIVIKFKNLVGRMTTFSFTDSRSPKENFF